MAADRIRRLRDWEGAGPCLQTLTTGGGDKLRHWGKRGLSWRHETRRHEFKCWQKIDLSNNLVFTRSLYKWQRSSISACSMGTVHCSVQCTVYSALLSAALQPMTGDRQSRVPTHNEILMLNVEVNLIFTRNWENSS